MGRLTPKQKAAKNLEKMMKRAQREAHRVQLNVDHDPELNQLLKNQLLKKIKKEETAKIRLAEAILILKLYSLNLINE